MSWCHGDEQLCERAGRAWPLSRLSRFTGRPPAAIRERFPAAGEPRAWTPAERDRLRALFPCRSVAAVAAVLGTTLEDVAAEADRLGLIRTGDVTVYGASWTPSEDATLRKMRAEGRSRSEIAAALGRPANGVKDRIERLGIVAAGKVPYSPDEDARLLEMRRAGAPWNDVAAALGRPPQSVRKRARALGWFGR